MSAEKALLDVMTLMHLNNPDGEENNGEMELDNVKAQWDSANAQYCVKQFAVKKGLGVNSVHTESWRTGQQSSPDKQIISNLSEQMIALQKEESRLVNDERQFNVLGLTHLVKEPSPDLIHVESNSEKECQRKHEKVQYQAALLQKLCAHANVPDDNQDYIDTLCNSILTGAYDFCKT